MSELEPKRSPFSRRSVQLFAVAIAGLLALGALIGGFTRGGGTSLKPTGNIGRAGGSTGTTLPLGKALTATLASLMGLTPLHSRVAPSFGLEDQLGHRVTLAGLRGRPVVLTFADAGCTGICPIEMAELRDGEHDLGAKSAHVELLVVNIDTAHRSVADIARLAALTGLGGLRTFHALTGPPGALRTVRTAYGVQVSIDVAHRATLYEPLIVFIDPSGREVYSATPSAFELANRRYILPESQIAAFGRGIAHFAASLLPSST